jgi:outer membrane receptor for ferrienterochelin and colicins
LVPAPPVLGIGSAASFDRGSTWVGTLDAQIFYFGQKANAAVTFFNSQYSDSITRAPIPDNPSAQTFINQGDLHMLGFEFEAKANLNRALLAVVSATYQHNADSDRVVIFIPEFMAKAGILYHPISNLSIGVFNTVFGKPRANSGARVNPDAKAVDLLSINANYRPSRLPLEFNLFAQDICNNPYYYTEFQRGFVNTLPLAPGAVIYASVALRLQDEDATRTR